MMLILEIAAGIILALVLLPLLPFLLAGGFFLFIGFGIFILLGANGVGMGASLLTVVVIAVASIVLYAQH
jgi:hypothetical protein